MIDKVNSRTAAERLADLTGIDDHVKTTQSAHFISERFFQVMLGEVNECFENQITGLNKRPFIRTKPSGLSYVESLFVENMIYG